jgi:hypothetical protein
MPRIYTSASDPLDFCARHFPGKKLARQRYGNVGNGPDGRGNCFGYNDDHPPYDSWDYRCQTCNCVLTERDD